MTNPPSKNKTTIGAGAAGAGAGTILIAIAETLGADSQLRLWLIYLSPAFSAFCSLAIIIALTEILDYYNNIKYNKFYTQSIASCTDALGNPHTSKSHKDAILIVMEELELNNTKRFRRRLTNITTNFEQTPTLDIEKQDQDSA